jgi:oligopeptidase A
MNRTYLALAHPTYAIVYNDIIPAELKGSFEKLISDARIQIQAILALTEPRSVENTIVALDDALEPLSFAYGVVSHLEATSASPELRAAYSEIQPQVTAFFAEIPMNNEIWGAVQACGDRYLRGHGQTLSSTTKRLIERRELAFIREGALLAPEAKRRFQEVQVALSDITTTFSRNVLDATNAWEFYTEDEDALRGLPQFALEMAKNSALEHGKKSGFRLSLQAPSLVPALTYLENRALRQEIWLASAQIARDGKHANGALIAEIVKLRREKAALLGYKSFPHYVLEDRMAQTPDRVVTFIEDLAKQVRPFAEQDNRELTTFAKQHGFTDSELQGWDVAYYAERMRKSQYEIDSEVIRAYFPLDHVLKQLFELAHDLFGISITADGTLTTWDPAVRSYAIRNVGESAVLSYMLLDPFPRSTKRSGAWMNGLHTGERGANRKHDPHLGYIGMNVTPALNGRPSLLTHDDVETLFHEFGHLLHHALSSVPYKALAGTNVLWDFVELPSMILENWTWEDSVLQKLSAHYETGAPLPAELRAKMLAAKNYRSGSFFIRQLGFSALDIELHLREDLTTEQAVLDSAREILQRYTSVKLPPEYAMITGFNHLFSDPTGYASGYYSYKWAEVLEADAFSRFAKEGIRNSGVGKEFREKILAQGNGEDPNLLFRSFMGRDPDPEALLVRSGLARYKA